MQEKMKKIAALFCWLSLLAGGVGLSCQVPVFRFALERWPADRFQLLVASRGPLEEGLAKEVASLRRAIEADANEINVDLQQVDVDQLSEAERISHPALDHLGEGPGLILMPPASWKTEDPVWVGEATTESLIARRLWRGSRKRADRPRTVQLHTITHVSRFPNRGKVCFHTW